MNRRRFLATGTREGKSLRQIAWLKRRHSEKRHSHPRQEVPLRTALCKIHLFLKIPLTNTEYGRESLAFYTQSFLQLDAGGHTGGLVTAGPRGAGNECSRLGPPHHVPPQRVGPLEIHENRANWVPERWGGVCRGVCVGRLQWTFADCALYPCRRAGESASARPQSLAPSCWLVHARSPGGLLGIQKVLLLLPGRNVQRDLGLRGISEYKELLARVQ